MTYAFTFDASACTGCKACQIACKDKNNLPASVLWRRVYEVSGGSWQKMGDAWVTNVFAYNMSIACNHCVHPKCAGVCPTDAFVQRDDGIVYIDTSKCIGCGYCAWACPYSAPRYHPDLGHMTKCDFCFEEVDAGLSPACVAACPMRVLDFVTVDDGQKAIEDGSLSIVNRQTLTDKYQPLWSTQSAQHPFPLPDFSRTEPHLAVKPHTAMTNSLEKTVSNWEEIRPRKAKSELPLVVFTLLGQMAAGMALFSFFSGPFSAPVLVVLGGLIGLAGLSSLLHLGAPRNAWRAIVHQKKSWLSREILIFGLFAGTWVLYLFLPGMGRLSLALTGIGLVYSMAQVYRLRAMPAWDTDHTLLTFAVSAVLLGSLVVGVVNSFTNIDFSSLPFAGLGLGGAFALSLSEREVAHHTTRRLRSGLILVALLGVLTLLILPNPVGEWIIVPIFIIVLMEEGIGRWLFYEHAQRREL